MSSQRNMDSLHKPHAMFTNMQASPIAHNPGYNFSAHSPLYSDRMAEIDNSAVFPKGQIAMGTPVGMPVGFLPGQQEALEKAMSNMGVRKDKSPINIQQNEHDGARIKS